jgi:lipoprotein-anchoring transpeptidase ErfK/SrfK
VGVRVFLAVLAGIWVLLLVAVAALGFGLVTIYRSDWILPGPTALGLELGNSTVADAAAQLQSRWQEERVVLEAPGTGWTVTPPELGLVLDAMAMARRAHHQSRQLAPAGGVRAWAEQLWRLAGRLLRAGPGYLEARGWEVPMWLQALLTAPSPDLPPAGGTELPVIWHFDRRAATATLQRVAEQLTTPPRDAGVQIASGHAEAVPAAEGRALDLGAALAALEAQGSQVVLTGHFALPLVPLQPAIRDVEQVVSEVNRLLGSPITVQGYDPIRDERRTWTLTSDEMAGWLLFEPDPMAQDRLIWKVDEARVVASLHRLEESLGEGRHLAAEQAAALVSAAFAKAQGEVRLRIYYYPRQHIVAPHETLSSIASAYGIPYPWIEAANPQLGETLRVGQVITIPSPDELLPLPVVENKRIIVSLSQQRLWAYEDGRLKWEWPVSTGLPSTPTSPGVFQVQSHELNAYAANWDLWMPYFMGIYQPVPGQAFMNGFHGFPRRGGYQLLWTTSLGRPATYGCILLSTDNARTLYEWAEEGVIVEVKP